MADSYDVVIIGGGPGGYNAAIRAGQLGLKAACVEMRATLGGTCLNVGCMPSKALLHASELFEAAGGEFATLGIEVQPKLNLPQMMKQKGESVGQLTKGIEFLFKKNKVDWVKGEGRISGPGQVEVTAEDGAKTKLAARNIVRSNVLRFPVRRMFDSIRGVDTLIWALVWINVVGLGPFAGVLAIAVSDFGAFGKLFSEAIEGADQKQVEGIRASGGSALHEIRFGLLPQVLPVIAGQVLYFIESNTRSATIIGIVGAGGIGLQLAEQIRVLEWQRVSFLVLMILVAVAAIDFISGKLRFAIIGRRAVA